MNHNAAATPNTALFVLAAFSGAGLIFAVQPMVAKLVLPLLGGSPAVWATSMAFFQGALLVGYGYAHLLQRLPSVRTQAMVHLGLLLAAALLTLPLRISGAAGEPSSTMPAAWLVAVLGLSVGLPFIALSATAPLVQAWHARAIPDRSPWRLYVASNFGSLVALLAYPTIVEPWVSVQTQRHGWSIGYLVFMLVMAALAFTASKAAGPAAPAQRGGRSNWKERLVWLALAAIPSSLMLGVTSHLATDVASAPFLWVVPLALYLVSFIIAFQERPWIKPGLALLLQAAALPACIFLLPIGGDIPLQFFVHLTCFFLTALVCHQALAARRPEPARLTEFYLWLSVGGVVGGAFNAFLAPAIFNTVLEYPLVLVLAGLARPWRNRRLTVWHSGFIATAVIAAIAAIALVEFPPNAVFSTKVFDAVKMLLVAVVAGAFLMRENSRAFICVLVLLSVAAHFAGQRQEEATSERSFFGVLRQSYFYVHELGGPVRMLAHGTTLHGAQTTAEKYRCRPLLYYAPETAIGQVLVKRQLDGPGLNIAAVGLGTGAVAAYARETDRVTFFEIDPLVVKIATDPKRFTYVSECPAGPIDYVIGDARLTLAKQPAQRFDIILVDAFSSDSIPTHLLTVEAMRTYLSRATPDGIVILHLSNRHLELRGPAHAVAKAAGAHSLEQRYRKSAESPTLAESSEDVVIVARDPAVLKRFLADPGWVVPPPSRTRPWTDDYTNVPGALLAALRGEN